MGSNWGRSVGGLGAPSDTTPTGRLTHFFRFFAVVQSPSMQQPLEVSGKIQVDGAFYRPYSRRSVSRFHTYSTEPIIRQLSRLCSFGVCVSTPH